MQNTYQHMFDIKTPQRIYYLAADTEENMRVWVRWICQVCGLQETTRIGPVTDVQYFNIGPDAINEAPLNSNTSLVSTSSADTNLTSVTSTTTLLNNNNNNNNRDLLTGRDMSIYNTYQNTNEVSFRSTDYTNRETILISEAHKLNSLNNNSINNDTFNRSIAETYTNFSTIEHATIERSHSLKSKPLNSTGSAHSRTQSLDEHAQIISKQGGKKVPEILRLNSSTISGDKKPSPALSSSSGPYIPISECFSGGAFRLDKSFGQSSQYSPKHPHNTSDSESVFTDDEWTHPVLPQNTLNRNKRQSETSLDNENLAWSYVTRFSKIPDEKIILNGVAPPRPPKRTSGVFSSSTIDVTNKESPLASPSAFIGPRDSSSVVDERYDIPRSHRIGKGRQSSVSTFDDGISPLDMKNVIASSTPNLIQNDATGGVGCSMTLPHAKHNFYTNAAPTKIEGNIFRYDFFDQV